MTQTRVAIFTLCLLVLAAINPEQAAAQVSDWEIRMTLQDGGGVTREIHLDFTTEDGAQVIKLRHGEDNLGTIPRGDKDVGAIYLEMQSTWNPVLRERFQMKRDPLNHPVDGAFFKALTEVMCWNPASGQFVDKKHKPDVESAGAS